MSKKTPPKGIVKTEEEKQFTPFTIEGTINYKITVDEEGYYIETERSVEHDLACVMLTKDVAEMFVTDAKITKKSATGKKKQESDVAYRKLVEASSGITIMSTKILRIILAKNSKI
jgi:hypothetical protein